jgi:flagellar basal body-associated protein FliL
VELKQGGKMKTIFKILIISLLLSLIWLFNSCDIQKEASKTKTDTAFKENIETKTFRKGDTVHYEIPNFILKDTTIYRTNKQGTTIRTVYDQGGNISNIDCFASAIEEIKKENREFQQAIKAKESKKTEDFDSSFIIYIMIGVVVLGAFALFLMFLYIKKNTALITQYLPKQ